VAINTSVDAYLERALTEAINTVNESQINNFYTWSAGAEFARQFYERDEMTETGEGDFGRVIARKLTELPDVPEPPPPPDYQLDDLFNNELLNRVPQFYDIIKGIRDEYVQEFFPDCLDKLSYMCTWLDDVMRGGFGLPVHIEDAIWNRDRSRVDLAYRAGADELFADHAARGFPMPSGPLAYQLDKLNDERSRAEAVASREAAIKQYETYIETVKFAVKTSADLYIGLHKVIDDVMKNGIALYLGAMDNPSKMAAAIAQLYGMQIAYYGALESWHKLQLSTDIPQGTLDLKADEINTKYDYAAMQDYVKNVMQRCGDLASMAQSALGSMQTITNISDETAGGRT
jgi:hypothetical protein